MGMYDALDYQSMARALRLARRGLYTTHPNPRVGCVLVKDGLVIGEGYHARAGEPHAEINALRDAGNAARGATAYVTLEPCSHHGRTPPCAPALMAAGITRVVAAMQDPNSQVAGRGLSVLTAAGIKTDCGLMKAEVERLNCGFVSRMRDGRPWVRVKLAMSLDGGTALASGESRWITAEPARRDVQYWRARSSAIMTGSGTLRADDPALTVRLSADELVSSEPMLQPIRIVLSTNFDIDLRAKIFTGPGLCIVFTACAVSDELDHFARSEVQAITVARQGARLDLSEIMRALAIREVNEVQVEAGSTLCGALLQEGLVDEMIIYMAPALIGDGGRGLFHLPEIRRMADRRSLRIEDVRMIGDDLRIRAVPIREVR
jgi:diaminohydroxyphosphoribosylaminopyrimidine deaminase / 5-amino-6-(5-phosphoribosylamino)uracil reductase